MSSRPPRTAAGYLLSAALLVGVLSQVPWATLGAALGPDPETYDEQAVRAAGEYDGAWRVEAPATSGHRSGPLSLHVAAWGQDFEVLDVSRNEDGSLVPPDDVSTLGRWDEGAWPGDGTGTVVLVVHRDSHAQGRGPFAELETLPLGSAVELAGRSYRLTSLDAYAKQDLPADRVFGQEGSERLVIVTCGGTFSETRGWDSNIVATFRAVTT